MLDTFAREAQHALELPDPETGAPPKARLGTADGLRGLWKGMEDDDELGSYNRSVVRSLLNGAPPYDQAEREEEGQGDLFNVNTGHGRTIVDAATSGVMEIFNSDRNLACVPLKSTVPEAQRTGYQRKIETRF
jgi:hypothetical protein